MTRCTHCGGDDHGSNQCPDMPPPSSAEDRKTFTIPPGHEAVRDGDGRATGEVRPCSADTSDAISIAHRLFDLEIAKLDRDIWQCQSKGQNRYVSNLSNQRQNWLRLKAGLDGVAQSASLPELPAPVVAYADHSYPAYSKRQMQEYGQACALAAQPPAAPVEASDLNPVAHLGSLQADGSWSKHPRSSAGTGDVVQASARALVLENSKLREEVEKWHRVAMEAGAITCVGGTHIYPLRDEVKKLREWKAAIIDKCKASDGFDAMEWTGDKEGWGFIHYFIGHLETRALQAEVQVRALPQEARQP